MEFEFSAKTRDFQARLLKFMDDYIYPNEPAVAQQLQANTDAGKRWSPIPKIEELKKVARQHGLWNLFLPVDSAKHSGYEGAGLTNLEYAPLAEIMGRVPWASEVFNCSAPDTGNMETIARYGSEEIKARWLKPLLEGEIRSAFAMTEPEVASSDATNISTSIRRDGDHYVINGHKWWTSGAADPRCAVFITMGKTDPDAPRHQQQSMIVVPADTPGLRIARQLCAGLAAAHEVGVLHRDIKPENLILEQNGNAKLMDFGIARPIRRSGPGHTEQGSFVGTPNYSPPEQLAGEDVDQRADIYSSGVLMCEMFCGKLPFSGSNTMEIYIAQTQQEPIKPSAYWPEIPPPMEAIILRCLKRLPQDRFASAAELAQALAQLRG